MAAGILNVVGKYLPYAGLWLLVATLMVSRTKALSIILIVIMSAGCVSPGSLTAGSPTIVAVTVAPTPAPTVTPGPSSSGTLAESGAVPENEAWLQRYYTWTYKDVEWRLGANISKTIYEFYRNKPGGTSRNYADYALAEEDRPFLDDITAQIQNNGRANGYTGLDDVQNVLKFVQSIEYVEDTGSDHTRYPLETLADKKGDCKDKAILGAAMLHEMGCDVVLLRFPSHMALGIKGGGGLEGKYYEYGGTKYYYAETSGPNWDIGDIPGDLEGQTPVILPMSKSPSLESAIDVIPAGASGQDSNYLVSLKLRNSGPGTASNLSAHFYALALDRGQDRIWPRDKVISIGDYGEGHSSTINATLTVYSGERTQIFCVITGDNVDTYEKKSSVFYG
jgi:hypothetical protein